MAILDVKDGKLQVGDGTDRNVETRVRNVRSWIRRIRNGSTRFLQRLGKSVDISFAEVTQIFNGVQALQIGDGDRHRIG